jgi:hypothetical protein
MNYYDIEDNNDYDTRAPEISEIIEGLFNKGSCIKCGHEQRYTAGDILTRLVVKNNHFWPDAMQCCSYPCFVVSDKFIEVMKNSQVKLFIGGKVLFASPTKGKNLPLDNAPSYYWLDGKKHLAGKMDFDASGFVGVRFCDVCGNRTHDISKTYDRQHYSEQKFTHKFSVEKSLGLDIFTTDLSPTAFFCNEKLRKLIKLNKLTNLRLEFTCAD